MTTSDRPRSFWRLLFGRGGDHAPAELPPPLFQLRPVPPLPAKGPGLPDWDEILSAAPPAPDPDAPKPRPTLVQAAAAPPRAPKGDAADPPPGAAAKRAPTETERAVLVRIGALLAADRLAEAAALLDGTLRQRPEVCDADGRPIYLLESLHCALRLGAAEAAAERASRLRPHLAADDPVVEVLYARAAIAAGDRAAIRANWRAALARAPDLAEATAWLAAHPLSPAGGTPVIDLLSSTAAEWVAQIQPAPSLSQPPATAPAVPDWSAGRLLANATLSIGDDGQPIVLATPDDQPVVVATPDAGDGPAAARELALVFRHPEGVGRPNMFAELLTAAFVLQRQFLAHLAPARIYVGCQPWAEPGARGSAQAEMLAVLFPGIRVIGEHDGAPREAWALQVDGALRNTATGTLIGSMMPQVVQWAGEMRARVHAALGLPDRAEPPRVAGRRPRVLYVQSAPPRSLAEPARDRLFGLFVAAGYEVAAADAASLPWPRLVRLAYGADLIAGVDGPAMDLVMWAHPQTRILEFFPEGTRRYHGQLLAEAAGVVYLGIEGVAEGGFVIRARERWGPPVGGTGRLVRALPWATLEQALAKPTP